MPTFDSQGEPARDGAISCPTCHDPHAAASADGTAMGPLSSKGMFLWPAAHQSLCVDCHGIETVWRFLYYHKANRNPHPSRDFSQLQQEP